MKGFLEQNIYDFLYMKYGQGTTRGIKLLQHNEANDLAKELAKWLLAHYWMDEKE